MKRFAVVLVVVLFFAATGAGMVMNPNPDTLPPGCTEIAGAANLTVTAGTDQAEQFNGVVYAYSNRSLQYDPCTKLTVTFINTDEVRHQWMVHGLPTSIHQMGMFNIEVTGPGQATGSFILPADDSTLLVHCGVPQHEQKGMKAQIVVGEGSGDLESIPGHTGSHTAYQYARKDATTAKLIMAAIGMVFGAAIVIGITAYHRRDGD